MNIDYSYLDFKSRPPMLSSRREREKVESIMRERLGVDSNFEALLLVLAGKRRDFWRDIRQGIAGLFKTNQDDLCERRRFNEGLVAFRKVLEEGPIHRLWDQYQKEIAHRIKNLSINERVEHERKLAEFRQFQAEEVIRKQREAELDKQIKGSPEWLEFVKKHGDVNKFPFLSSEYQEAWQLYHKIRKSLLDDSEKITIRDVPDAAYRGAVDKAYRRAVSGSAKDRWRGEFSLQRAEYGIIPRPVRARAQQHLMEVAHNQTHLETAIAG